MDWQRVPQAWRGPAAAKHRSPKLFFERRTTHIAVSVDRSRSVLTSEVSLDVLAIAASGTLRFPNMRTTPLHHQHNWLWADSFHFHYFGPVFFLNPTDSEITCMIILRYATVLQSWNVTTIRVSMEEHVVKTLREIHTLATVQRTLPAKTVNPVCMHFISTITKLFYLQNDAVSLVSRHFISTITKLFHL